MIEKAILPALVLGPMAAAFVGYLIGRKDKKARDYFAAAVTILEFAGILSLIAGGSEAALAIPGICGMGISFRADGFRMTFAWTACYMWMMTTLFSREYMGHARNRNRYYLFLLITLGAVVGVFLSDDLFTTFIFFEIMSMASYVCVVHEEKKDAMYAGGVYLAVAVIGGMVTLMGLFLLYQLTGTLAFSELLASCQKAFAGHELLFYVSGGLILFGFGAKAGMYPLHVWLPMAHPVAPAPASALLSGIITKTGIFGVLILTSHVFLHDDWWGTALLLLGVVTMLLGGILAVFSLDLKRTLACSSMSQLGFIFVGMGMQGLLGEENALAVRGTLLHMFNHSNLKLVLFMAAGVVVMNLHKLDLNEIRGFGRKKPLLAYVFLMGSLGIGGIPLWNGYISKTLIHESIVEYTKLLEEGHASAAISAIAGANGVLFFKVVEWLFILTGAMTVAYMTKLFAAIFVEKNNDEEVQRSFDKNRRYIRRQTANVLGVSATVLPFLGCFPSETLDCLADFCQGFLHGESPAHAVQYFSLANLEGGLYSVVFGALIYLVVIRKWILVKQPDGSTVYVNRWPQQMDLLKLFYEPAVLVWFPGIVGLVCRLAEGILDTCIRISQKTLYQPIRIWRRAEQGYLLSFAAGTVLNWISHILNRTIYRKKPVEHDYIEALTRRQRTLKQANKIVAASASFSLLMFGIGLVVTVLYLFLS